VCACIEQYPGASQQNIGKYFSLLWEKPIDRRCVGDIMSDKEKQFQYTATPTLTPILEVDNCGPLTGLTVLNKYYVL
jgi:hypothetical protein